MRLSRLVPFALGLLVALAVVAPEADARPRHARAHKGAPKSGHVERTVTRTGPDGTSRTSQHETSWQRGGGTWSRDTVHTGPKGGTTTVHGQGTRDPDTKSWTREKTVTRPNGATTTTQVSGKVTPVTPGAAKGE